MHSPPSDSQKPPASVDSAGAASPYAPPSTSAPAQPAEKRGTSTLAVIAFVASLLFFLPFVPLIGSILGIVALVRGASRPQLGGKGLAIAAIPVGVVVFLVIQAMMAAIAIPAFVKYTRKVRTVEATEALDKIVAGAKAYARADHYDSAGTLQPSGFPVGDTGWTPTTGCCQGTARKCKLDSVAWGKPLWRALSFTMPARHFYQYRYSGRRGSFVVEARGDLDCDGTFASYTMRGSLGASGDVRVVGPVITNETE
jgi:type II secretory pathway pseudopilin PulG